MSPLRLLLEGPDLNTLLEQIRREYGAEARIIQAEKVRRGGVGGFFARERFNIQLEVPAAKAPQRAPSRAGSSVKSVMDLVDRLNREDEALHHGLTGAPGRAPSPLKSGPAFASHAPSGGAEPPVSTRPEDVTRPSPKMSTQSVTFAQIMSRLEQSIDTPVLVPSGTSGGPVTPMVDKSLSTALRNPTLRQPAALESQPRAKKALAARPLSPGAQIVARATRMGVPWYVLADIDDPTDVYRRLLAWVESRPKAPVVLPSPGQVIVVVGEVTDAMGVAGALADQVRVDRDSIHLAVPATSPHHDAKLDRLLTDASDIALRRQGWQRSVGGTIVVVDATLPMVAQGWLAGVVSALAPTFTWAVAQASTKVNDVVSWASVIGDVNALALVNLSATGDPAAALAGPLPVGLLDGQRPSVTSWMAMLTDEGESR